MTLKHGPGILRLIAISKFLKMLLLLGLGIGALGLMHKDLQALGQRAVALLHLDPENIRIHHLLHQLTGVSPRRLGMLGIGSFIYATLFAVEGVGLWRDKRWGEYLTIVSTALLLPLEIYELSRHVTAVRIIVLILNTIILIYLIYRLRFEHGRDHPANPPQPPQ
jgi:uncharacterized membrane protein (DUF2068 family)